MVPPACFAFDVPRHPSPVDTSNSSPTNLILRGKLLSVSSSTRNNQQIKNATVKRRKQAATWQCSVCSKLFTRGFNLRSHMRTHTNERPFLCALCGKAFGRQHDRKRHEKLHYGEESFVCGADDGAHGQGGCGRTFVRRDGLARHLRSDTGSACVNTLLQETKRQYLLSQQSSSLGPNPDGLTAVEVALDNSAAGSALRPSVQLAQYPSLADIERRPPGTGIFRPISGAYATWWNAYMSTHHR